MGTDKKELTRGIKYMFGALPLLLFSPILITVGYKAIKLNNNYLYLIIGILMAIVAVVLGYLGIKIILDALFDKKR